MLEATGIERERLQRLLADTSWVYPRCSKDRSRRLHRIFDARRAAQDESKLKASCSELLGVYGLLRFFVELELSERPDFAPSLRSLLAVCRIIDLLLAAKRRHVSIDDVAGVIDSVHLVNGNCVHIARRVVLNLSGQPLHTHSHPRHGWS